MKKKNSQIIIIKLDKLIFNFVNKSILKLVYKFKHKQTKYDISLRFNIVFYSIFYVFVLVVYPMYMHLMLLGVILHILIWSLSLIGDIITESNKSNNRIVREIYREVFDRRKDPEVYNTIKELCEVALYEHRRQRYKKLKLILYVFAGIVMLMIMTLMVNAVLVFWFLVVVSLRLLLAFLTTYLIYVFDFDPPEKKRKKEKSKMTDLVASQWQKIVEQTQGKSAGAPI